MEVHIGGVVCSGAEEGRGKLLAPSFRNPFMAPTCPTVSRGYVDASSGEKERQEVVGAVTFCSLDKLHFVKMKRRNRGRGVEIGYENRCTIGFIFSSASLCVVTCVQTPLPPSSRLAEPMLINTSQGVYALRLRIICRLCDGEW